MALPDELQKTTIEEAVLNLYVLDATRQGGSVYRFHSANQAGDGILYLDGAHFYGLPINVSGIEITSKSKTRPTLEASALAATALGLFQSEDGYDELIGATLRRFRIMERYLDNGSAPDSTAIFGDMTFVIVQLEDANREMVRFRLGDPSDAPGARIPGGRMLAGQCTAIYRGPTCQYAGDPLRDIDGNTFLSLNSRGAYDPDAGSVVAANNTTHFKCDESSGSTLDNLGAAGAAGDGTVTNATFTASRFQYGNALTFVNASAPEVTAPTAAGATGTEITVSVWFRITDARAVATAILAQRTNLAAATGVWVIEMLADGTVKFTVKDDGAETSFTTITTVNDGLWHHVSLRVREGSFLACSIDNQVAPEVPITGGGSFEAVAQTLQIGGGDIGDKMDGQIDDIRVISQYLTDAEVWRLSLTPNAVADQYVANDWVTVQDPAGNVSAYVASQAVPKGIAPGTKAGAQYWTKDVCDRSLDACTLRFPTGGLNYDGFPGIDEIQQ